jgi:hypothetical protein
MAPHAGKCTVNLQKFEAEFDQGHRGNGLMKQSKLENLMTLSILAHTIQYFGNLCKILSLLILRV